MMVNDVDYMVMTQRSDVEQFFLDSLGIVRSEISNNR